MVRRGRKTWPHSEPGTQPTSCEQEAWEPQSPSPAATAPPGSREAHHGELSWNGTYPSLNGSSLAVVPVSTARTALSFLEARAGQRVLACARWAPARTRLPCPGCRAHVGRKRGLSPASRTWPAEGLGIIAVPRAARAKPEGEKDAQEKRSAYCSRPGAAAFPPQQGPS